MFDSSASICVARSSHDRVVALLAPLTTAELTAPSYAVGWSIADVASHLGSHAEIFGLYLDAGLTGQLAPGSDKFGPIWDRWNGLPAQKQVWESITANETFVGRLEELSPEQQESLELEAFGARQDLEGVLSYRIAEHVVHTWDIGVTTDSAARLPLDAVELLIDAVPERVARRSGKPADGIGPIAVLTAEPDRVVTVTVSPEVAITPGEGEPVGDPLRLPGEALLRLVYGRLDSAHKPRGCRR